MSGLEEFPSSTPRVTRVSEAVFFAFLSDCLIAFRCPAGVLCLPVVHTVVTSMVASAAKWYTVYTLPNLERKIHLTLTRKHIMAYLPLQEVVRQWSDRLKKLRVPLFPNYLFVHIRDVERAGVLSIAGVTRFVAFEGRPAIISNEEIELIRKLEAAPVELESPLLSGDRVRVVSGPFAGLEGILFQKKGKARFGVHLEGLRQALSLEICASLLKKL